MPAPSWRSSGTAPGGTWNTHATSGDCTPFPGLIQNSGKIPGARNHLRFDRITQPWLRVLAKRWCRLRLTSGLAVGTVMTDMNVLTRFSRFLDQASPTVDALAGVDRPLLERYLAWIAGELDSQTMKEDAVTCLNTFFRAIRQHGWDPTLPTTAVFFTGDTPRRAAAVVPAAVRTRDGAGRSTSRTWTAGRIRSADCSP